MWWLFFFQAEDGIRDTSVTGVQTCALPIYRHRRLLTAGPRRLPGLGRACRLRNARGGGGVRDRWGPGGSGDGAWHRSEERRVGKEWRSRWSGVHDATRAEQGSSNDSMEIWR